MHRYFIAGFDLCHDLINHSPIPWEYIIQSVSQTDLHYDALLDKAARNK